MRIIVSRIAMRLLTTDAIWPTTIQAAGSRPKNARGLSAPADARTTTTSTSATYARAARLMTPSFLYARGTSRSWVR